MCICEKLPQVRLSPRSIEKLLLAESLHRGKVERRVYIEGSPVVLIAAIDECGNKIHRVLCAGDVWYRKEKRVLPDKTMTVDLIMHDTYHCARKAALRLLILRETIASYAQSAVADDPRQIIMDIFARVSYGEYLGEFSPGCIYVQEIAEIFEKLASEQDGLVCAGSYCTSAERKKRYENDRPEFFLLLGLSLDKSIATMLPDGSLLYASLTESEWRTVAFFEDTLALVQQLVKEKYCSLNGMILCAPFPEEIPDKERVLLGAEHPLLVYSHDEGEFTLEVQRHHDTNTATFCLFERRGAEAPLLIFTKPIALLFGAPFGPDAEDVARWNGWFINYIEFGSI